MWSAWAPQHAACTCEHRAQALTLSSRRRLGSLPQPAAALGAVLDSPRRHACVLQAAPACPQSRYQARRPTRRRSHQARSSAGRAAAPALERGAPDLNAIADRSTEHRAPLSDYDLDSAAALAEQKAAHREAMAERDPRSGASPPTPPGTAIKLGLPVRALPGPAQPIECQAAWNCQSLFTPELKHVPCCRRAAALLDAALERWPDNAHLATSAAVVAERRGERLAARRQLRRVLERWPAHNAARAVRSALLKERPLPRALQLAEGS